MQEFNHIPISILTKFPQNKKKEVDFLLQAELKKNARKIIVLDDDPTGVQTVHDVSVYTCWDKKSIEAGFAESNNLFYILTNSRGLSADAAEHLARTIAQTIISVSRTTKKNFLLISRSDSTLRGHYPLETETLRKVIELNTRQRIDGEILCFFFEEGERFTVDDIHYVQYNNMLIPAGETEFARDKTFGYTSSNLCDYIEEKTSGQYKASDTISIALRDLRLLNFDKIEAQLMDVHDFQKIIVNAIDTMDVKVFCIAVYRALAKGKEFIFRSAASLVKGMGGISEQALLTRSELNLNKGANGGLIIIGSYTQKTTEQLYKLLENKKVVAVPFDSDLILQKELLQKEIERVVKKSEQLIEEGKTAVVFTNRRLLTMPGDTKEVLLQRSVEISHALQSIVSNLKVKPTFIIAKGGITSSDIGTKALSVRKATVLGQLCPGVPVWCLGPESKFPSMPYIIFPGNVGSANTLRDACEKLL